jgi:fatty-acyl-CoA synthase
VALRAAAGLGGRRLQPGRGYRPGVFTFTESHWPAGTSAALEEVTVGGTMDERGYFRVTGRLKDMIVRGGENLYQREIAECLFAHPGVADVAVVGVPDERWDEVAAAVIRPADPADPPEPATVVAHCRQRLAPHKTPRHWSFVDAFPLTGSGKVQKFMLRDEIAAGELTPPPDPRLDNPSTNLGK